MRQLLGCHLGQARGPQPDGAQEVCQEVLHCGSPPDSSLNTSAHHSVNGSLYQHLYFDL